MPGIIGYGVYIPKYRLKVDDAARVWGAGGKGEKSVCGADEDIITMAAEAAEKAIHHAGIDTAAIEAIHLGTSSAPFIEKHLAPILAETLALPPETSMIDYCGSPNAASLALLGCVDAIGAGRIKCGLVIGTDNRAAAPGSEGETSFGAGAAAFVIGNDGTIADIEGMHTHSTLFTDRWRAASDGFVANYFDMRFDREYGYEKHIVGAGRGLMGKLGRKGEDFNYVAMQQPDGRLPAAAARRLGIKSEQLAAGTVLPAFGDLGSCSAFIGLAAILEKAKPGERILVATYGSGSSLAMSLLVRDGVVKKKRSVPLEKYHKRKEYIDYPTYLKLAGAIKRAPY